MNMSSESFPSRSSELIGNPFREIRLAQDNKCSFSIEGNPEVIHLRPQEFRLLTILKKARGALVDQDSIESFFYGEQEGDLPLSDVVNTIASRLRLKLQAVSSGRFGIYKPGPKLGYQLTDTQRTELKSTVTRRGKHF